MKKNRYERTVCGMGYLGYLSDGNPARTVDENGQILREYVHWSSMINRCYNDKVHATHPSYIESEVDEKWLEFAYFYEHFNEIEGYEEWLKYPNKKWHLDKDIKIKNNKIYSIENCILVENSVNAKEVLDRLGNQNPYIDKNWIAGLSINDEEVILYKSPIKAQEDLGIDPSSIRKAYKGEQRSAYGYQWLSITKEEYEEFIISKPKASELRAIFDIPEYSTKMSEGSKKKMVDSHWSKTGKYTPPGKKVVCLTYPSIVFESASLASKWCKGNVKTNCRGKTKTAGRHPDTGEKLSWAYYEDYIKNETFDDISDVALQ